MKLGVASVDGSLSGEETDELQRFQKMTLPQKRDYIKRMEELKSGFMTPGMQIDNLIDIRIQELDRKFKDINFGQTINHDTFEYFKPRKLDPEENAGEYRKWKLRQIILKQHQFEQRIDRFKNNLESFRQNKKRVENFRTLAAKGYDERVAEEKDAHLLD